MLHEYACILAAADRMTARKCIFICVFWINCIGWHHCNYTDREFVTIYTDTVKCLLRTFFKLDSLGESHELTFLATVTRWNCISFKNNPALFYLQIHYLLIGKYFNDIRQEFVSRYYWIRHHMIHILF